MSKMYLVNTDGRPWLCRNFAHALLSVDAAPDITEADAEAGFTVGGRACRVTAVEVRTPGDRQQRLRELYASAGETAATAIDAAGLMLSPALDAEERQRYFGGRYLYAAFPADSPELARYRSTDDLSDVIKELCRHAERAFLLVDLDDGRIMNESK